MPEEDKEMGTQLVAQKTTLPIAPDIVLKEASKAAKALQGVVASKPKKIVIQGKHYLEYADWQTLGKFYRIFVETSEAEPVEIFGVKGAKAKAIVYNEQGVKLGGAEAYCMRDEQNWGNKPWFQLASMAQTRAGSKSLRNMMGWVAVLAGYADTPAEEMHDGTKTEKPQNKPQKPTSEYKLHLDKCKMAKIALGDETYYDILGGLGYEHANEIKDTKVLDDFLQTCREQLKWKKEREKEGK